jgi:hypothetical protein
MIFGDPNSKRSNMFFAVLVEVFSTLRRFVFGKHIYKLSWPSSSNSFLICAIYGRAKHKGLGPKLED